MLSELITGIFSRGDGSVASLRGTRTGALAVSQAHGALSEAAMRNTLMEASQPVGGVAPGTALSTTPPLILWNPPSSGKLLCVTKISAGYVSGTLGAGTLVAALVQSQNTIPSGGTELVPQCCAIGMPRGVGRAFTGSTLASTPVILRPLFVLGAFLATTAIQPTQSVDLTDGTIVVMPGSAVCVQGIAAAGTSPLMLLSIQYEEVPI